jgi:hypothetical protein
MRTRKTQVDVGAWRRDMAGSRVAGGPAQYSGFANRRGARFRDLWTTPGRGPLTLRWGVAAAEADAVLLGLAEGAFGQAAQFGRLAALVDAAAALGGLLLDLE